MRCLRHAAGRARRQVLAERIYQVGRREPDVSLDGPKSGATSSAESVRLLNVADDNGKHVGSARIPHGVDPLPDPLAIGPDCAIRKFPVTGIDTCIAHLGIVSRLAFWLSLESSVYAEIETLEFICLPRCEWVTQLPSRHPRIAYARQELTDVKTSLSDL